MHKCGWKLQNPSSTADRISRQKTSKDIAELSTIKDLIDIYRILHSTTAENPFYSSVHRTYTKTDHILNHKTGSSTHLKELKSYSVSFNQNGTRLETKNRKITGISSNIWKPNTILNILWVPVSREMKIYIELNENKNISKFVEHS